MSNPIPFNPDTMTVSQLKDCAQSLSLLFDMLNNGKSNESIYYMMEQAQDSMSKRWAR